LAIIVAVDEHFEEPTRKDVDLGGRHEATACDHPKRSQRKVFSPEVPPLIDSASVGSEEIGKFPNTSRRGALPHGGDQDDDGTQVHLSSKEADGRGRDSFSAAVALAAEAEPVVIICWQITGPPTRLPGVLRAVESPAARADLLPSGLGNILVDEKKKLPKAGIARQTM
jgi:hypothetical protein